MGLHCPIMPKRLLASNRALMTLFYLQVIDVVNADSEGQHSRLLHYKIKNNCFANQPLWKGKRGRDGYDFEFNQYLLTHKI